MSPPDLINTGGIIFGAIIATVTLYYLIRNQTREQEEKVAAAKEKFGAEKYAEGVASVQPELARVTSERNDAWKDRDVSRAEATRWENRYLNLRDGQTQQDDRNRRDATDDREANPT